MAGALDWLMNLIHGPQATVAGDGVTYGPAVSRLTRTPIDFSTLLPYGGQYHPSSNSMTVNPNNTNDVSKVVRHESVHALLSNPALASAAVSGPLMNNLMLTMPPAAVGQPSAEAPAYVSQNEPGMRVQGSPYTTSWPADARNQALAEMLKNVQHKDASAGVTLQRLSVPPSVESLTARIQ